jgi:uncharacterized membrane protein
MRALTAALAVPAACIASYLVYVRETGSNLLCTSGGCETVQNSKYAEILGVPVAGIGAAGFIAVVVCAVAPGWRARLLQAALSLAALIFSTYLLFVQLHSIGAVCDWCLFTDVLTSALAVTALLRIYAARSPATELTS